MTPVPRADDDRGLCRWSELDNTDGLGTELFTRVKAAAYVTGSGPRR